MAHFLPSSTVESKNDPIDDARCELEAEDGNGNHSPPASLSVSSTQPVLFHKVNNQRSILALLVSESQIFAGTQGGDLLVWSLESFELLANVHAHRGSILCLHLSGDKKLLFSSAGDALVNVWCTKSFSRQYSIYSKYDVGDVFCVVFSAQLQTAYLGAQNTSIQVHTVLIRNVEAGSNWGSGTICLKKTQDLRQNPNRIRHTEITASSTLRVQLVSLHPARHRLLGLGSLEGKTWR